MVSLETLVESGVPCGLKVWFKVAGTFVSLTTYVSTEDAMQADLKHLPMKTWLLLVVPLVALAYPVCRVVIPSLIHAVVPEVVRNVLSVI